MKNKAFSLLFLLSFGAVAIGSEDVSRISILSLLRPTKMMLTIQSGGTSTLALETSESVFTTNLLHNSVLPIESGKDSLSMSSRSVKKASIRCPGGCQLLIDIPGKINRLYHGDLDIYPYDNTINIVLIVRTEELVGSIATSEMGEYREPEALKGFAVLVRTFLKSGSHHPERNADFCDTTHCQVFQGFAPQGRFLNASRSTSGLVLTYRGQIFQPFYSKSCGGKTTTFLQTWNRPSKDYPFYSVDCAFCRRTNINEWRSDISLAQLRRVTGKSFDRISRSDDLIQVSGTEKAGYTPENFRILLGRQMGWKFLPGNEFQITQNHDSILFQGKGAGHGVGLCQTGSAGLAREGKTFRQILSYYFPNTELKDQRER
jgi:stage II sporulation protein D (peptidoglycan lytic transglycosylase)